MEGELLDTLTRALADARPGTWRSHYLLGGGADFFTYSLTLDLDGRLQTMVGWNDGVEMPSDLAAIRDALQAVGSIADCNPVR